MGRVGEWSTVTQATCTAPKTCKNCPATDGEIDSSNHSKERVWVYTENTHKIIFPCCGEVNFAESNHNWYGGSCRVCNYVCAHDGSKGANCQSYEQCGICARYVYGDHVLVEAGCVLDKHCSLCSYAEAETAKGHAYGEDITCDNCGYINNGLVYQACTVSGTKGYELSGLGTCTDTDIYVSPVYNDLPVLRIRHNVFNYSTDNGNTFSDAEALAGKDYRVFLPASVTAIGTDAFNGCSGLKEVRFAEGSQLRNIESRAFRRAMGIEWLIIPNVKNLGIGTQAFQYTNNLKYIFFMGNTAVNYSSSNDSYTSAKQYWYSQEKPQYKGSFWYYDENNNPQIYVFN